MGNIFRKIMLSNINKGWEKDKQRIAQQSQPLGVRVEEGIAYIDNDEPMNRLNLYWPENANGLLPAVIAIHGGAWMCGDANIERSYCMYLASKGFAVMGMSYRLLPHTDLKGQVQDIFSSLHWLAENGEAHGFDLSKVLLTGGSAGGHFAGLCGCIQLSPTLQELYGVSPVPFDFTALAVNHAVCDITNIDLHPGKIGEKVKKEMHQMMFGKHPERSPLWGHAGFAETAPGLDLPPVMCITSEPDELHHHTLRVEKVLQQMGTEYKMILWKKEQGEGLGHCFNIGYWDWPESIETNDSLLQFFNECIRNKEKAVK